MSVKASLLRRAALTLVAGVAISLPMGAKADLLHGLSLRAGAFFPSSGAVRDITDVAMFGGGVDYKVGFIPKLLNGESWTTSISADMYYASRKAGIARLIPVSINQVYTFEQQNGHTPYAGFCFTAATLNGTNNNTATKQPTVTRFGGGLLIGLNISKSLYWEAKYEWIDRHGLGFSADGFRTYVGWRF
jgi:hypothetical protein